ncbi:DUF885 domain-containing protein [Pollutibacter soli]|uniref:DUF885 domain-containing protein n=1 Tax=Pollutibacter soli TaxID=3034157 RepID=UPI003013BC60
MRRICLSVLLMTFAVAGHAQQAPLPENKKLRDVLTRIDSFNTAETKRDSTLGRPLGSHGEEDYQRNYHFFQRLDAEMRKLDTAGFSFADRINYELLLYSFEDDISTWKYKSYLNPLLADGGFHTYLPQMGNSSLQTKKEFEDYIKRMRDIRRYVDEHLVLMRKGLGIGVSQPAVIFTGYESTYNQHIVSTADSSAFFKPFQNKPAGIAAQDWDKLVSEARTVVMNDVVPSYKKISDFFKNEYLPKTRKTLGASEMPDGRAFYNERIKHYTTLNTNADEVFITGLREVERIHKEMLDVMAKASFKGSLQEFILFLRTDPRFYPKTADDLLKEAAWIAKKADNSLPLLFGKLPRQPYGVEPVPASLAPVYTAGRYSGSPIKSKRAGHYWVNTYNLPSRTLYTLEALTLHEAVPGHHLQIALTQELDNLPQFRRNLYVNAFGEGWGLYCEFLGYEMGFYKDPYSRFGQLTYDMWRACRLVIDVGIHAKGWTRDQAVTYLSENTALSLHEVNTEINRYISWPGQALAYKTGELTIKSLRKKATEVLGEKFDVRSFHDMILSEGTVTMEILTKMTDQYIAKNK